jgi:Secretion system C-terminal sorting domain/FG-GAP-like repeat
MDMPVQVIDFDLDGDADFLWGETNPQYIAWCRNDGDLAFTFSVITEDIESLNAFTAGDIDNDGDNDIVLTHSNEAIMLTLLNDGSLTFTSSEIDEIVSNPKQIVLSDMENDNDVDIVFASQYDRRIEWLKNPINNCPRSYSSEVATICLGDSIAFMDGYIENAGLYSDTLISFTGCDSVHVLELSLYPIQTISITQNVNTLTATSSFSDYQWYFNGNLLTDENTNSIDAAEYGTGNYSVTATGDNQCNIASTSYNVNSIVTVAETANNDIQVYPNPFNDGVFITAGKTIINEIKIIDITGRIIQSSKANLNCNNTFFYDLNKLAVGKYMIQCTDVHGNVNTSSIFKQ